METRTATERLAAGEAVHPDDMTDAELLAVVAGSWNAYAGG